MSEANKDFVASFAHTHVVIAVCVVPRGAGNLGWYKQGKRRHLGWYKQRFRRFLCLHTRRDRRVCRPAVCVVLPPKIIPQLPLNAMSSFAHTHVVIAACVVPPCVSSRVF